jgi:hypothetical protein
MAKAGRGKKKLSEPKIFSSIRKPLAPPGHPLNQAKPEEKARPAGRKAKHKQRAGDLATSAEAEE